MPLSLQDLMTLLAGYRYPGNQVPWDVRDPIISPAPIPNRPMPSPPEPEPGPSIPMPPLPGGGGGMDIGGGGSAGESGGQGGRGLGPATEGWGRMDPGLETGLGLIGMGMLGMGNPIGLGPLGMSVASRLAGEYTPDFSAPPETSLANVGYYGGAFAEQAARDAAAGIGQSVGTTPGMESGAFGAQRAGERTGEAPGDTESGLGQSQGGTTGGTMGGDAGRDSGARGGGGGGGGAGGGDGGEGGGGSGGCFVKGTRVHMADGGKKAIEEIAPGDAVLSWHEWDGCFVPGRVAEVFPCFVNELVEIHTSSDQRIVTTPPHRFLLENDEYRRAGDLKSGDTLKTGIRITQLRRFDQPETPVWNFRVDPTHTYVVERQIVHNAEKARGGVVRAKTRQRVTFGEAGKETGVFVPEWMKRPGIQGKEQTIVRALQALLRDLQASRGGQ